MMTSLDVTPGQFLATLAVVWLVGYFIQRRLNPVSLSKTSPDCSTEHG